MRLNNRIALILSLAVATVPASLCMGDYQRRLINSYHGQQNNTFCGPATAQMILDSDSAAGLPISVSQANLNTKIQAANNPIDNFATDPQGMAAALNFYDPAHNYVPYSLANFDSATRTLAYNIDHYSIPGGALIGQGAHWINIIGVNSSAQPSLTSAFSVNGFYARDPWSGFAPGQGLGKSAYLANTPNGLWKKNFTPVANVFPSWKTAPYTTNFCFVTDPDTDTISTDTTPSFSGSAITLGSAAITQAGTDITTNDSGFGDADLSTIPSFENGAFQPMGEFELPTEANGGDDWLVPYYQTGDTSTPSGVALIDAATGALDGAFWDDGTLDGDSLSSLDSLINDYEENGIVVDNIVPEPASLGILGVGVLALMARRRRR